MGLSYTKEIVYRVDISCLSAMSPNNRPTKTVMSRSKPSVNQFCSKHCDCRDTAMITNYEFTITVTMGFLMRLLQLRPVAHYIVHLTCSVHECVGKEKFLVFA